MRYAYVPNPIQLKDPMTGNTAQTVTFREIAISQWLNDPRWEKPKSNLARLAKILPEFEKSVGEMMKFEDADFNVLTDIIKNPHDNTGSANLAPPLVQLQLEPFCQLVLDAKDKDPTEMIAASANGKATAEA